jgi:PII-like signaling protein
MKLEGEQVLLRVFVDTFQKWRHRPVYEALVERARAEHLAGATVLAGIEGLGPDGEILQDSPWRLANDRPVIVEIVDKAERIDAFLAGAQELLSHALVTLERAHVVFYRTNRKG